MLQLIFISVSFYFSIVSAYGYMFANEFNLKQRNTKNWLK